MPLPRPTSSAQAQENDAAYQEALSASKCYRVVLSSKVEIKCDADEVQRVVEGIQTGSVVRLRQGIFNPSFFVTLVEDEPRRREYLDRVHTITERNRQDRQYHGGTGNEPYPGFQKLSDIFAGVPLKSLGNGNHQLPTGQ